MPAVHHLLIVPSHQQLTYTARTVHRVLGPVLASSSVAVTLVVVVVIVVAPPPQTPSSPGVVSLLEQEHGIVPNPGGRGTIDVANGIYLYLSNEQMRWGGHYGR